MPQYQGNTAAFFYFIGNSDFKELKENKSSPNMC